ncbi:DHHA1 domain-containing protein [Desulfuromonas carbonis]|uniref:DHH family phosphoesterase n=1 Tax=Desulfuromonas sp. DDH964 TaxID=1823759 RepID=UPI00078ED2D4|nr:DHH family phosphoesterase [Desulfuromonas sp. DDH964]AMV71950.1 DHH domain-containing phosphoesterase [Desulfuromonas sp. DDH964]
MAVDFARSAEFSAAIIDWIRGKGKILIIAHDNPDPDSLAAAFALKQLFWVKTNVEATVAFGGIIGRGENRVMVRELEIDALPIEKIDLEEYGVVCMVDTQPGTGNNSYPEDREVHIVIDHHPLREATRRCRWFDVREDFGASATILFEYLQCQDVYIGTKLATILYYAIKTETQDLGREWNRADRDAYLKLLPLSNNRILYEISHPRVPREYFFVFNLALENARIYEQVLVFNLYQIDNPDIVAEMADFLLRMEGVEVVMGMGCFNEREILSLRTASFEVVAGEVIHKVVGELGTAGGHNMTAGAQIVPMQGDKAVQKELEATLTRRLLETLQVPIQRGRRLIPA